MYVILLVMSLHLILGPMFSGKSTRLIQHIRTFTTLEYTICTIKPDIDTRYTTTNELCTHNQEKESCLVLPIDGLASVCQLPAYTEAKVVMIEEGQFFTHIYDVVRHMMDVDKKHIYISALNGDSERALFGDIYKLLPLCSHIEWLTALCKSCKDGTPGVYSKRKTRNESQIQVASSDVYEAVCLTHYIE
jgi:thymidine kinase